MHIPNRGRGVVHLGVFPDWHLENAAWHLLPKPLQVASLRTVTPEDNICTAASSLLYHSILITV
jgi:hypothetical protein